jgi:hypothetical protein
MDQCTSRNNGADLPGTRTHSDFLILRSDVYEHHFMVDADLLREFEAWYEADTAGDREFAGRTALQFLAWAESKGWLDKVLNLRGGNMSVREWVSIHDTPMPLANPFPDVRRKGGDHDRGFSPALNQEIRNRIPK